MLRAPTYLRRRPALRLAGISSPSISISSPFTRAVHAETRRPDSQSFRKGQRTVDFEPKPRPRTASHSAWPVPSERTTRPERPKGPERRAQSDRPARFQKHARSEKAEPSEGLEDKPWNENESNPYKPSQRVGLAARKELPWLRDPAKLADRVSTLLEIGDDELALHLTRLASKEKDSSVVAWNHLIDYYLKRQARHPKLSYSLKLFNEMKKRAQSPDARTYALLLSGMHEHDTPAIALPKALALYQSMCEPDSRIKPSQNHTNYILMICRKAGDMKSLWEILHKMPESGPGAPTTPTFTILLGALAAHAQSPKATYEWATETVETGRQIWEDVVRQWENGVIAVDGRLTFSMATLLLRSPRAQDWDDLFSLIEQTTGIKRLVEPVGSKSRPRFFQHGVAPEMRKMTGIWELVPDSKLFHPVTRKGVEFVPPSNQLLTSVLIACQQLGEKALATAYWKIFTKTIDPDLESTKSYLRTLRFSKSSAEVLDVVREFTKTGKPDWGLYRIAMSACAKNSRSGSTVLREAMELYDLRKAHDQRVDMKVVDSYLTVLQANIRNPHMAKDSERQVEALLAIAGDAQSVIRTGSHGWSQEHPNPFKSGRRQQYADKSDNSNGERTAELAKRVIGLFDKLINDGVAKPAQFAKPKEALSEYVRKFEQDKPSHHEDVDEENGNPKATRGKWFTSDESVASTRNARRGLSRVINDEW